MLCKVLVPGLLGMKVLGQANVLLEGLTGTVGSGNCGCVWSELFMAKRRVDSSTRGVAAVAGTTEVLVPANTLFSTSLLLTAEHLHY